MIKYAMGEIKPVLFSAGFSPRIQNSYHLIFRAMNNALDRQPIEDLQLSMKALGSLKRTQIQTIGDLMNYTEEDLRILDPQTSEEVIHALQQRLGLTLPANDLQ